MADKLNSKYKFWYLVVGEGDAEKDYRITNDDQISINQPLDPAEKEAALREICGEVPEIFRLEYR